MGREKRGEEVRQPEPKATSKRGHWGWSGWFQKQNETKRMIISDGLLGLDTTVRNASDISISLAFLEVFLLPTNESSLANTNIPATYTQSWVLWSQSVAEKPLLWCRPHAGRLITMGMPEGKKREAVQYLDIFFPTCLKSMYGVSHCFPLFEVLLMVCYLLVR